MELEERERKDGLIVMSKTRSDLKLPETTALSLLPRQTLSDTISGLRSADRRDGNGLSFFHEQACCAPFNYRPISPIHCGSHTLPCGMW